MNSLTEVIQESERFLRDNGIENYRGVNVVEFAKIVFRNGVEESVEMRNFKVGQVPLTQVYVELNGECIYSTTID